MKDECSTIGEMVTQQIQIIEYYTVIQKNEPKRTENI